jgi:hypothetical protein
MQKLLQGCQAGLDQAAQVFKVWSIFIFSYKMLIGCAEITTGPAVISEINAIKEITQHMHKELLELIQTQSDNSTTSNRSSVCTQFTACSPPIQCEAGLSGSK